MTLRSWFAAVLLVVVILLAGVLTGAPIDIFLDLPSLLMVAGLTCAGALWSFPRDVLGRALRRYLERDDLERSQAREIERVFSRVAELAVDSGSIGTLIGLVLMLHLMDDPSALGPATAVALLPLLYGIVCGCLCCQAIGTHGLRRAASTTGQSPSNLAGALVRAMCVMVLTTLFVALVSTQRTPASASDERPQAAATSSAHEESR